MPVPVAKYKFNANLLQVVFEDLSTNTPTGWAWDFGNSTNSNSQNPTVTYTTPGTYTVKLTATNSDGSSSFSKKIVVSSNIGLNETIEDMVISQLPPGMVIDPIALDQAIKKWQIYLQPKVSIPYEVSEADTFNQSAWPPLASSLITQLVIYDQLIEAAGKSVVANSLTGSEGGSGGSGTIKKIESGPSVAEWYNSADFWKNLFGGSGQTGFFALFAQQICMLASRQNIYIPEICGKRITTIFPKVFKKPCRTTFLWGINRG
ncbi:MAG TPA: PKD domain-containing protein [Agriterribacter sp.]|nr:PKD domain-containing protein [Agriterribacter sp.]